MDSTTSSAYFLDGVSSLIASITPFPRFPGYLGRSRLLLYFDSERKTRNRQGRVRRLPCCPGLIHYSPSCREGWSSRRLVLLHPATHPCLVGQILLSEGAFQVTLLAPHHFALDHEQHQR